MIFFVCRHYSGGIHDNFSNSVDMTDISQLIRSVSLDSFSKR